MQVLWKPSTHDLAYSQMARFGLDQGFSDFNSLYRWSVDESQKFWQSWLKASKIVFEGNAETVFDPPKSGEFYGGSWFPEIRLNYAENLMHRLAGNPLIGINESGKKITLSANDLRRRVRGMQLFMSARGVKPGDRVAACLPNGIEAVIGLLAASSLGAVWSSCSPDFGLQGMLDRFSQIEPKFFIGCASYLYGGKTFEVDSKLEILVKKIPSIKTFLIAKGLSDSDPVGGQEFLKTCLDFDDGAQIKFERLAFNHPLYILFSSGTTGVPKCLIHSAGGTLLQHSKEHILHGDLKGGEKILYFTTCGWMMWNWVLSSLFCGASLYCYDGSPAFPAADSLWQIIIKEGIDVFGTSAKFLASNRVQKINLSAELTKAPLRLVLSTGSPLMAQDFEYFYTVLAKDSEIQLSSISGGTDIVSCFMLGNPLSPVLSGEIQGPGLGMKIEAFNESGKSVIDEKGELVCTAPFPSMPTGFWNDKDNKKFFNAYFARFPSIWHHGDYITIRSSGGIVVHGRSDATLNPGGVRIGTSEIYRQVESLEEIADSLVVGQSKDGDERVILFVKLKKPGTLSPAIVTLLKDTIKKGASPRHVPTFIFEVLDLPYTLSGKKVELAVKQILAGTEPQNTEALANPASLDIFRKLRSELGKFT